MIINRLNGWFVLRATYGAMTKPAFGGNALKAGLVVLKFKIYWRSFDTDEFGRGY